MASYGNWSVYSADADLVQCAMRVKRRMVESALPSVAKRKVNSAKAPGRLRMAVAVSGAAQRSVGIEPTGQRPFKKTERRVTATPPMVVGFITDVSGSMGWSTTAVGEATWALARGAAHAGARIAALVYGEGVHATYMPGEVPSSVIVRMATDGTESANKALAAIDGALGLSDFTVRAQRGARLLVVISDLHYTMAQQHAFAKHVARITTAGTHVLVIGVDPTTLSIYETMIEAHRKSIPPNKRPMHGVAGTFMGVSHAQIEEGLPGYTWRSSMVDRTNHAHALRDRLIDTVLDAVETIREDHRSR